MRIRAGEHDFADMVARPGFKSGKKNRKRKKKKSLVHLKVQEEEHKDDNYNSNNDKRVGDDRFVMLILAASIAAKRDFDRDFNFRDFEAYGLDLSQKKLRCFCNSFLLGTQNKKRRKNCCSPAPAPAPAPVQMGRGNLEPENKDSVRANVKNNDAAEAPGSEGTPRRVWGRRNSKNMAAGIEEEAAAAVEFESRCKRRNGRGWRCKETTMMGYSLCEYHLHKSARFKSLGGTISSFCKAKNNNTNSNNCKKHLKQQQKKSLNEISV